MDKSHFQRINAAAQDAWEHFRQNSVLYWKTVFFMLAGIVLLGIVGDLIMAPVTDYLGNLGTVTYGQAFSIALLTQALFLFLIFIWTVFFQGLLVHISLRRTFKTFREILSHFRGDYGKFFSLAVFLFLVGLLALVPYYGISLVMLFDLPGQVFLSDILLVIFLLLVINIPWLFVFTPYVMLDKHLGLVKTLQHNFQIIKGHGLAIFGYLLMPLAILLVINLILTLVNIPNLTLFINLLSIFIILPLIYSFLGSVYQRYSAGH